MQARVTVEQVRRWLKLLQRPDQLGCAGVDKLLSSHGRSIDGTSPLELGEEASRLITETIGRLDPPAGSSPEQRLPYLVLKECFIDGTKRSQAATRLGLSERQLTRERTRALGLLKDQLRARPLSPGSYRPEPIPVISDFVERPALTKALSHALETHHQVEVLGPMGIGKTSVVAELAIRSTKERYVLWHRFRPGINVSVDALLIDLAEHLRQAGFPQLSSFIDEQLPHSPDVALATRVALKTLANASHLLIFDDFHLAEADPALGSLLDEMVARLPGVRRVTISRHRLGPASLGVSFEVPAFSLPESKTLLEKLSVRCSATMVRSLHSRTEGNPYLLKLAAVWLKTATDDEISTGLKTLTDLEEVRGFLVSNVAELLDSDDRTLLGAASVFRDFFSDNSLAYVSGLSRGTVVDATQRLTRIYVATRSRQGDMAFFHSMVRDYVYSKLSPTVRAELHRRASTWYLRSENFKEAEHHRAKAQKAEAEDKRLAQIPTAGLAAG